MSFTSIKDVNLEIMSKMDDRTLLNICATNKYGRELCQNESFWHKRFLQKYGEMAAKHKPEKRSWKNHYMQIVIDTNWRSPAQILSYVIWDPRGIEYSRYTDFSGYIRPMKEAPEKFLNAFYLMDLGPFFYHKTAYQLLDRNAKEKGSIIDGQDLYKQYHLYTKYNLDVKYIQK